MSADRQGAPPGTGSAGSPGASLTSSGEALPGAPPPVVPPVAPQDVFTAAPLGAASTAPQGAPWSLYTRRVVILILVAAGLALLYMSRGVITPLIMAGVITLLMWPLVTFLNRRLRVPRVIGAVLAIVVLLLLFLLVVVIVVPLLIRQFGQAVAGLDDAVWSLLEWLEQTSEGLRTVNLLGRTFDFGEQVDWFQAHLNFPGLVDLLPSGQELMGSLDRLLSTVFGGLAGFAASLINMLVTLGLTMIYTVYLLAGDRRLPAAVAALIPPGHESPFGRLRDDVIVTWRAFFRGQLLLVSVYGVLVGAVMWAIGLPSWLVVGLLSALFDLIPTLGALLAGGVTVVLALFQGSSHLDINNFLFALLVVGVMIGLQQLEASVLQPRIVGNAVELPPVLTMFAVTVGASVAGVLGAFLAVPVAATARLVLVYVLPKLTEPVPATCAPEERPPED